MRMRTSIGWVARGCGALALAACGSVAQTPDAGDGPVPDDAGPDASTARCDPTKPFGAATLVPSLSTSGDEVSLAMSRDEKIAFLGRSISSTSTTLLMATRASPSDPFGDAVGTTALAAINGADGTEYQAWPTADALVLYFHRQTSTEIGILAATRADVQSAFDAGSTVFVGGSGLTNALTAQISADGQTLYWLDFMEFKLHSAVRTGAPTQFGAASAASTLELYNPVLSSDELTLYYSNGVETDVLAATRATKSEPFGTGVPVGNVNSPQNDAPAFLTADGCILYLRSNRPGGTGGTDVYEARRPR